MIGILHRTFKQSISWVDFLEGLGGLNPPPPKFFLSPFRKCLTPLEFSSTPLADFGLPFHAPPEASRTAYCIWLAPHLKFFHPF